MSALPKTEYFPFWTSSFCSLSASEINFFLLRSVFNNVLVILHNLLPAFTKSTADVGILIIFTPNNLYGAGNVPLYRQLKGNFLISPFFRKKVRLWNNAIYINRSISKENKTKQKNLQTECTKENPLCQAPNQRLETRRMGQLEVPCYAMQ